MDNGRLAAIYDGFAAAYDSNRELFNIDEIVHEFLTRLARPGGSLLDLGCGAGVPVGRIFIDAGWAVTGVDFSSGMLELARRQVPQMRTIHSDICAVELAVAAFDAVTLIYSMFHIPRQRHAELLEKMYRWLKPGGMALFTYATRDYTGSDEFDGYKEFLGQRLFYSHNTPETLLAGITRCGFLVDSQVYRVIADERFLWLTLRKPVAASR